jgi:tetratricopeptide (TPR) repeat protein
VYNSLPSVRRAACHKRILEVLLSDREDEARHHSLIAHHAHCAADLLPIGELVTHCIRAGDSAYRARSYDVAVDWFASAVGHISPDDESEAAFELSLRLGQSKRQAGATDHQHWLERAFAIGERRDAPVLMARAALAMNPGQFRTTGIVNQAVVDRLHLALDALPAGQPDLRAQLLATLACELTWADGEGKRFALSDDALREARGCEQATLARVLLLRLVTIVSPQTLEERRSNAAELNQLATELVDDDLRFWAAAHLSGTLHELGDIDGAYAMVDLAERLATRLREPALAWQVGYMRAATSLALGDLRSADARAEAALDLGRDAGLDSEAVLYYTEQILEIRRWQDRLDEHRDLLALAGNDRADLGFTLSAMAMDAGMETEASRGLDRAAALPPSSWPRRSFVGLVEACHAARLAAHFDHHDLADALYHGLLPYGGYHAKSLVSRCVVHHYLGVLATSLGMEEQADDHFGRAHAEHVRVDMPLTVAEIELEWARSVADWQPERSAELVVAAGERGLLHGSPWIVRRAEDMMKRVG